jgi:hypothetical protein
MPESIQTFSDRGSKVHPPNLSPSPFRILRNDTLPWAVILIISEHPGCKKARKKLFLRGIRKISVSKNGGEFTAVPFFYGNGKELLFESRINYLNI